MTKEKFLLDANVFITPYKSYYPFNFAPGFWKQLSPKLTYDEIGVLDIVKDEITKGSDTLSEWIESVENIHIISRKDEDIIKGYTEVVDYLKNSNLYSKRALKAWSMEGIADPWLIAAALAYQYTIITLETATGKITTVCNKPKIPSVGQDLGVKCESLFSFMRKMQFKL